MAGDAVGRQWRARTGTRSVVSTAMLVIGALLFMAGVVAGSVYDTVYSSNRFAGTATKAIQHPAVKAEIENELVDQLIAQRQDLIAARPLIQGVVDGVIGSKPFQKILTAALLQVHHTFFSTDKPSLVLDVSDGTTIILGALKAFDPNLAASVPVGFRTGLIKLSDRPYAADIVATGRTIEQVVLALGGVGFLLLAGAVVIGPSRRRALIGIGIAFALGALVIWLMLAIGRDLLVGQFEDFASEAAVAALYNTFLEELYAWVKIVGIVGVVLAAAASATVRLATASYRAQIETVREIVTHTPATRLGRLTYLLGVLIGGVLLLAFPSQMVATAVRGVGLVAIYLAITELVRLAGWSAAPVAAGDAPERRRSPVGISIRPLATAALVGLVAVGGFVLYTERDALRSDSYVSAGNIDTCNGFKEFCDRHLNEVVFPGTHNAMSAAREPGWFNAEQTGGIIEQLDYGIRALLIDVHYGFPGDGGVSSDQSDPSTRKIIEAGLDQETIDAARRIAARRVTGANVQTKKQLYLCHGFCELGATSLDTSLGEINDWLDEHPNEVVILFFEDYVSPQEMDAAFNRTRLIDYVYTHVPGAPFPTLREMIENDERVVVLSENVGGKPKPDWYHDGFSLVQETPYAFKTPQEMSCAPNRGQPGSPLFQINHWIEGIPPSPGNAAIVNGYDFLLARARQCQTERGHLPNIIAVDFYETGAVLEVANTLNGVGSPPEKKPSGG